MNLLARLRTLEHRAGIRQEDIGGNSHRVAGLPMSHVLAREICNRRLRLSGDDMLSDDERAVIKAEIVALTGRCQEQRQRDFKKARVIDRNGDAIPPHWSWEPPVGYGDRFGMNLEA